MDRADSIYRSFFEDSVDAMLVMRDDVFVDCNPAAVSILGFEDRQALLHQRLDQFSPSTQPGGSPSRQKAAELIEVARERGHNRFEWQCLHRDGREIPLDITLTAGNAGEEGNDLYAVWRDITTYKEIEEAIREGVERYRQLYEETPAMLHSIDAEGRLVSVSDFWLSKLGYTRAEVINRKSSDFLTEESRRYAQEVVLPDFFRTGHCFDVPYQIRAKNGEILDILLSAIAERDDQGHVTRSLAVLTDVTEYKKAADALRESEYKFRLLLNSTAEAIYGVDTNGLCTFCNPACLALLGYEDEAELLGRNMHELVHNRRRDGSRYPEKECKIYLAYKQNKGVSVDDEVLWRADGSCFDAAYRSYPMRSAQGVVGAVVTFEDITERKKAEAALVEAKNSAEEASKVKSEFLAKVSHEIRTPMTVFMSAVEHLLDIEQDPTHRKVLDLADLSSQRLYVLIEAVLDFSRLEDNKMQLEVEPFNLRKCLQDIVELMTVKTAKKGLVLEAEIGPDVPEEIQGDEYRLGQVLLNLIGNAIKFTEKGRIDVSVTLDIDQLVFAVKDTGIGIPADKQQSIFEAFSQANSSTTRMYGGTGLGLAISKGLVELMGGQLSVQSQPGVGSQFSFTLPLLKH